MAGNAGQICKRKEVDPNMELVGLYLSDAGKLRGITFVGQGGTRWKLFAVCTPTNQDLHSLNTKNSEIIPPWKDGDG